jgi:hypothetical protein
MSKVKNLSHAHSHSLAHSQASQKFVGLTFAENSVARYAYCYFFVLSTLLLTNLTPLKVQFIYA